MLCSKHTLYKGMYNLRQAGRANQKELKASRESRPGKAEDKQGEQRTTGKQSTSRKQKESRIREGRQSRK